ncbi:hypothetical protein AVEN_65758-1 [Araneus ventricosus]|uniref:Uncharacterized protein n=1 Tax=Araneus ventricosus TaxID=182803 RepID=A0A4Y2M198_ARAVE|nr:hypothetical protein AVEN_65758-1 [Araneus ventricosus]
MHTEDPTPSAILDPSVHTSERLSSSFSFKFNTLYAIEFLTEANTGQDCFRRTPNCHKSHLDYAIESHFDYAIESHLDYAIESHLDYAIERHLDYAIESHLDYAIESHFDYAIESHLDYAIESHLDYAFLSHLKQFHSGVIATPLRKFGKLP